MPRQSRGSVQRAKPCGSVARAARRARRAGRRSCSCGSLGAAPLARGSPIRLRLPKWRPPTEGRPAPGSATWPGRWSLVRTNGILGVSDDESVLAEVVARQWLDRYGVVTRDWWKREHPTVTWRAIYRELKRLEFRGDVRRGYFVRGLAGAQFALPSAVEQLRTSGPATPVTDDGESRGTSIPLVVMAASDPANPYSLAAAGSGESASAALARGRSRGALL